ncbi:MAG TPA: hypothetical protein VN457_03135, partial [Chlamydiales bacterium]|nr:hypothetical protein [Chlamydiales bacterium]
MLRSIEEASVYLHELKRHNSAEKKVQFLLSDPSVRDVLASLPFLKNYLETQSNEVQFVFLALIAVAKESPFIGAEKSEHREEKLKKFQELLLDLEHFYAPFGGVIGYHLKVLELIEEHETATAVATEVKYLPPPMYDLRLENHERQHMIVEGIRKMDEYAEIYPVGGAGDRLNLIDAQSGRLLPAARLQFLRKDTTLLELLLRDLEAREYLYFKLFFKTLRVPVVLMTSEEKLNAIEIDAILKEGNWFGRGKEGYFQVVQPLVPVICCDGKWALTAPLEPVLKPGGHGVIWKL